MISSNKEAESTGPVVQKGRPDFGPSQVRELVEIKPGMVFVLRGKNKYQVSIPVMTIGEPFYNKEDIGDLPWISIKHFKSGFHERSFTAKISLADYGVVPYHGDTWHSSNWLEDPSKVANPDKNPT